MGILKNRVGVVAFLVDDDRPGYKRFSHAHLLNHFLSRITIDALVGGEVPKMFVGTFCGPILVSFADVLGHIDEDRISSFVRTAVTRIAELGDLNRSRRISGPSFRAMGVLDRDLALSMSDVSIDEALVVETVNPLALRGVVIAQLDARGADIRAFCFEFECHVFSLMANAVLLFRRASHCRSVSSCLVRS